MFKDLSHLMQNIEDHPFSAINYWLFIYLQLFYKTEADWLQYFSSNQCTYFTNI